MNIETKRLVLRAVEPHDAKFLSDLVNDPEVNSALGAYNLVFPMSVEMEERWIESMSKTDDVHMTVVQRSSDSPMGIFSIKDINKRNGSAHISIILERKSWDKGYGTEAVSGVLEFLFSRKNAHRVWLRVSEHNERAIACYKKCGFKVEGTLREDHFARDSWRSSYLMSILQSEFRKGRP